MTRYAAHYNYSPLITAKVGDEIETTSENQAASSETPGCRQTKD